MIQGVTKIRSVNHFVNQKQKRLDNALIIKALLLHSVVMDGIEPPTHRFSVYCSTD